MALEVLVLVLHYCVTQYCFCCITLEELFYFEFCSLSHSENQFPSHLVSSISNLLRRSIVSMSLCRSISFNPVLFRSISFHLVVKKGDKLKMYRASSLSSLVPFGYKMQDFGKKWRFFLGNWSNIPWLATKSVEKIISLHSTYLKKPLKVPLACSVADSSDVYSSTHSSGW